MELSVLGGSELFHFFIWSLFNWLLTFKLFSDYNRLLIIQHQGRLFCILSRESLCARKLSCCCQQALSTCQNWSKLLTQNAPKIHLSYLKLKFGNLFIICSSRKDLSCLISDQRIWSDIRPKMSDQTQQIWYQTKNIWQQTKNIGHQTNKLGNLTKT